MKNEVLPHKRKGAKFQKGLFAKDLKKKNKGWISQLLG